MMEGTGSPFYIGQEAGLGHEVTAFGADPSLDCDVGLGSVRIGGLRWTARGPAPLQSVQDGYLQILVDRHSSVVGNPFCGAPRERLCRAFDALLTAVLHITLDVKEGLCLYKDFLHELPSLCVVPDAHEASLVRFIADQYRVKVHRHACFKIEHVHAWLCYHASLLAQGRSLHLFCWCAKTGARLPPWTCHAQSLAEALRTLARSEALSPRALSESSIYGPLAIHEVYCSH